MGQQDSRVSSRRSRARLLLALALLAPAAFAEERAPSPYAPYDAPNERMFERLRALNGEWQGTFEWSQGRTGSGPAKATYYLTGAGSAVVENLTMGSGTAPIMSTVYHLDGADLRMTHYCAARNQPRLKASHIDAAAGQAEFAFVDVTNVSAANPGYVEGLRIEIVDANHLKLRFAFGGGPGRSGVESLTLTRVQ